MSLTEHQPKQDHLDLNIWSESKIYNPMFLLPELFGLNIFIDSGIWGIFSSNGEILCIWNYILS